MIFDPFMIMFVMLLESSSMAVSRFFLWVPIFVMVVDIVVGLRATCGICSER